MTDKEFFQIDHQEWFEEYKLSSPTHQIPGTPVHTENYFLDVPQ